MSLAAFVPAAHAAGRPHGPRRRVVSSVLLLLGCLALIVGVLFLTPVAVGGSASYVVTSGTSMLPTYEAGGVIVTQERQTYGVGDVVAYRNPELGDTVVLHRIVDNDGESFVMQGDNNDFLDSYRPTSAEVVGEAWVYVPRAGEILATLRQPVVFGLLITGLTLVSLRSPRTSDRRRRRHHGA